MISNVELLNIQVYHGDRLLFCLQRAKSMYIK